jgi:hypothetical protein
MDWQEDSLLYRSTMLEIVHMPGLLDHDANA